MGIANGLIGVWNRSSLDKEPTHRCHSSVCLKMLNLVFAVSNTCRFRTFLRLGSSCHLSIVRTLMTKSNFCAKDLDSVSTS